MCGDTKYKKEKVRKASRHAGISDEAQADLFFGIPSRSRIRSSFLPLPRFVYRCCVEIEGEAAALNWIAFYWPLETRYEAFACVLAPRRSGREGRFRRQKKRASERSV